MLEYCRYFAMKTVEPSTLLILKGIISRFASGIGFIAKFFSDSFVTVTVECRYFSKYCISTLNQILIAKRTIRFFSSVADLMPSSSVGRPFYYLYEVIAGLDSVLSLTGGNLLYCWMVIGKIYTVHIRRCEHT
ncbi:hypothetical protein CHS0354_019844 [Potamilus streckersoni]|uniref:Uncharacterized protein n=1 Tax=Potamilus streckersoni TaxID=2493646 RepID=A0AAE0SXX8_9BIVA|nr:hypothetical protein CHS0354_019844 [Potamilus streckersoni]